MLTRSPTAAFAALLVLSLIAAGRAWADERIPRLLDSQHFTIDPVVDGVVITTGVTFDELLSEVISTGEIKPTPPSPNAVNHLLSIDRAAVTQTIDPHAGSYSSLGLYAAFAYAVVDPLMSGWRDGWRAGLVDAVMYGESYAVTGAVTDITKIAVRRPRPIDYAACSGMNVASECDQTDLQLSFFSLHAARTAAISATATYLAFIRSGWRHPRPWITLGVGTTLTALVSYWRVRAGEHFPTDVIMGSVAGAGIGVLVPHFHRRPHYHQQELETAPVIIGYAPVVGGGTMTAAWTF
jgi:membrane-associated phospholipid phosphatase